MRAEGEGEEATRKRKALDDAGRLYGRVVYGERTHPRHVKRVSNVRSSRAPVKKHEARDTRDSRMRFSSLYLQLPTFRKVPVVRIRVCVGVISYINRNDSYRSALCE